MVGVIQTIVICGTLLLLAFMVLLSMPKSMLRCILLELVGWTVAVFACVYTVSPIDCIPDFIPILGWIDDVGAIAGGVGAVVTALNARKDRKSLEHS